jgi:hypothetical protein
MICTRLANQGIGSPKYDRRTGRCDAWQIASALPELAETPPSQPYIEAAGVASLWLNCATLEYRCRLRGLPPITTFALRDGLPTGPFHYREICCEASMLLGHSLEWIRFAKDSITNLLPSKLR